MLTRWVLLLMAAAMTASCASAVHPARGNALPQMGALPPLPEDAGNGPSRHPASSSVILSGDEYYAKSDDAAVIGQGLDLTPAFRGLSYAVYQFAIAPGAEVSQLAYYVKDRDTLTIDVWCAVANYQRQVWQFFDPLQQDSGVFALPGPTSDYTGPGGNLYVALLAYSMGGYTIQGVELWQSNLPDEVSPWPMLGHDVSRTRRTDASVVDSMNVLWKSPHAQEWLTTEPVFSQSGMMYIGAWTYNDTGFVHALRQDGSLAWQYSLTDYVAAAPAVGPDGTIYVACHNRSLYALNRLGFLRWRYDAPREILSSPLIGAGGNIYFGCIDSRLYALHPDGSEMWSYLTNSGVYGSPAQAGDGTLYVTNSNGDLYAIGPDGTYNWSYDGAGEAKGSAVIGKDGTVYYATQDGNFYSVHPDGTLRGSYPAGGQFIASPALASDDRLWLGNTDGTMYVFNPDASLNTTFPAGASIESSAAIDGAGRICFGCTNGHVYVLNSDLSVQWDYIASEGIRAACSIGGDGTLYCPGAAGTLFAFGPNAPQPPAIPTGLSASDGTQYMEVVLTWDEGYDANGYEIYKDGGGTPVATVGYVQHWEDVVADTDVHTYMLKAVNEYGKSDFSAADTGYANDKLTLSPWALYRGNPAQTNCALNAGPAVEPADSTIEFGFGHRASPAAFAPDGSFRVYDDQGKLHFYAADGTPGWTYNVMDNATLSPCVGPAGNVYVKGTDQELQSVSALGAYEWTYDTSPATGPGIAGMDDDGRVYVSTYSDGFLRCVNPDGSEAWKYDTGNDHYYATCAIGSNGAVYFGDFKTGLVSLDSSGHFNWCYPDSGAAQFESAVRRDPVGGDLIYVGTNQGLACLGESGAVKWFAHDENNNPVYARPTLAPDGTIFSCGTSTLDAINPDGLRRKRIALPDNSSSTAIATDCNSDVYVGCTSEVVSYDNQLNLRWQANIVESLDEGTVVIGPDGKVYVNDNQHKLHIFSPP